MTGPYATYTELLEAARAELAAPDAPLPPPPPPSPIRRLMVDTLDGETLAVRLLRLNQWVGVAATHDGATQEDLDKVRRFPERKWNEREGAWLVKLTDPNVDHLLASWPPGEYELTAAGKLLLDYHLKTAAAARVHQSERLRFLAEGLAPNVDGLLCARPPYPHQLVAASSARLAEFFSLTMEMGTGKSQVVVDIACDRARRKRAADPAAQFRLLITAPKTVCGNWAHPEYGELALNATLPMNVERLEGSQLRRIGALATLLRDKITPLQVAVINYEGLEVVEEWLKKVGWDLMVLDESIWIKNPDAQRSRAAYRVGETARSRFILTGLPITKNVLDLYGQYHFLKPGCLGFSTFHAFSGYFGEASYFGGHQTYRKEKLPELQERLSRFSFCIRRAQCVELPEKQYQKLDVEMTKEQAAAYEQMAEDLVCDLEGVGDRAALREAHAAADAALVAELAGDAVTGLDGDRFAVARIVLVKLLRLAQITSGFVKTLGGALHRFAPNPKLAALEELLEEIDANDKVVVWSRFVEDIEQAAARLAPYGAVPFYGGLRDRQREANLARFKTDPACRVFVGQMQSGGFGINLTEANHVVYVANDFGLGNRAQSEDRCHRIGQKKSVIYTDLVVPNTIDDTVRERLRAKRELADLLTDKDTLIATLRGQLAARKEAR